MYKFAESITNKTLHSCSI